MVVSLCMKRLTEPKGEEQEPILDRLLLDRWVRTRRI